MSEISKQALKVDNSQSFPNNNSGQISPSDLRDFNVNMIDSLVDEIGYNVDSASWNEQINALEVFTSSQQPAFTALNSFTASQLNINTGVNQFTQSADGRLDVLENDTANLEIFTSSINQIIVNGTVIGTSTRLFFNGFVSASIVPNVGGPIASITVLTDTTYTPSASFNAYTASTNQFTASTNISLDNLNAYTASAEISNTALNSFSASTLDTLSQLNAYTQSNDVRFNAYTQSNDFRVDTLSSFTGSYATTGSNTFIGDQTFSDTAGNASTLVPTSGSLMLVAKGFTSASAHLSASANSFVNIIFKDNNNTTDTIISGSSNIFPNPSAPTAGFKRYIGGSNNILTGANIPQISGSMQFSPTMNRNVGSFGAPMRGPVSASTWNISDNYVGGGLVNLGTAAAPMVKMVAGFNFNQNALFGGTINQTANVNTLDAGATFNSNIVFGATLNINHNSSSLNYSSNIQNGGITINNNYTPVVGSAGGRRTVAATINTVYGINHLLNIGGTNTGTTSFRNATANLFAGTYISASLEETGDRTSMFATSLMGNGLIISGTSVSPTTPTPTADASYGTVVMGRFNAIDGNKAKTAQTVFAVGTGTGHTNRKTGFLIDSGSNTFVEGTLNVSGSLNVSGGLSFTGSVYGNVFSASIVSSTASLDFNNANFYTLTLPTTVTTHIQVSNVRPGQTALLEITNAGTNATASFSTNVYQPNTGYYVPTATSGSNDILTFTSFNTSKIYLASVLNMTNN